MGKKRFALLLPDAIINDTFVRKSYYLSEKEDVEKLVALLNEYETVLNDTQTFTVNLCKFLMEKGLDEEFREKYGDENLNFKMSNAVYRC